MTLLVAALLTSLTLLLGALFGLFADGASDRGRAQAAADASALAAVAESAPGASGSHFEVAERFAEANGAELVECDCDLGATSVVVMVSLDGVQARARATIDPNAFLPANLAFDGSGLAPRIRMSIGRLIAESRGQVRLVSGWRSHEHQAQLWSAALTKYGDPEIADDWVARPGSSMHEAGLAVDLGGDLELAARLVEEFDLPLHRPLANEPWHFELLGSR
jgi:hypothetical protein